MAKLTPQTVWNLNEKELQSHLSSGIFKPQSSTIRFYAPSFTHFRNKYFCNSNKDFPTISVTGNYCAMNCKHCGGKVLETMHPAVSTGELFELGLRLKANGAKGVLVSGGCSPDNSVPLDEFTPVLARFKQELGLNVFVHTGIIKSKTAFALKDAGVDAALIDVVGSEETIKRAFNLRGGVQDYTKSLKALNESKLDTVPHVIVGLNEGRLDGEYNALQIIQQNIKPSALVIIAFMPIKGTEMAQTTPPKAMDITRVIATARLMFPQTPLVLGCMRPKGKSRGEIDVLALKAGVDAVAFPSECAIEFAKNKGYAIVFSTFCCAQIFRDSIVNS